MERPRWDAVAGLWEVEGSLRDVYVKDVAISDWKLLVALAQQRPHQYTFDGEARPLPPVEEIFADRSGSHLLAIEVGSVKLHAHFFIPNKIELDIDPREVAGPKEHAQILEFLEAMALRLGKPVFVTPEGSEDQPYLIYHPHVRGWAHDG